MNEVLSYLYEVIAKEAMYGTAVFTEDGECLFINRVGQLLLDAEKPTLQDLVPQVDRPPLKSFSIDFLKHEGLYHDLLLKTAGGQMLIGNVGNKHIYIDEKLSYLIMIQDVSVQKKMQREITQKQNEVKAAYEELLAQNRQLKELDVAKNRFIALTTHELRTPLSAMCASAEVLKLGLYDTPEELSKFVNMIYDQGLQLQELVNDILDFAKIQAGKMDFYISQQNIVSFAKNILHNFENMAESSKVTISFDSFAPELLCYFDDLRLGQVISNIVSNAIKYNRPQGTVRMYFEETHDIVRLLVEDTGKGIPADQLAKVFDEFETIGQVSQHHKGTGLGMPISRKLMEGMGGTLELKSEVGIGSTFWFEIPKHKIFDEDKYNTRPGQTGDLAA